MRTRPMRAAAVVLAASVASADRVVVAQTDEGHSFETLLRSVGLALVDPQLRFFLSQQLSCREGASPIAPLNALLLRELPDERTFGQRLVSAYEVVRRQQGRAVTDPAAAADELFAFLAAEPGTELSLANADECPVLDLVGEASLIVEPAALLPASELAFRDDTVVFLSGSAGPSGPVIHVAFQPPRTATRRDLSPQAAAAGFGVCSDTFSYKSSPLITRAAITDIHEPQIALPGYAYFAAAGDAKTGNLPGSLGGRSGWSTNVWASNFQGPRKMTGQSARVQWEWNTTGWLEFSDRIYPAQYCKQTVVDTPNLFSLASYTIKEHDDKALPDDVVGKARIDHAFCNADIFSRGLTSGWSASHTTSGQGDVNQVRYELYCARQAACSATTFCQSGALTCQNPSGTCAGGSCGVDGNCVYCGGTRLCCN